MPLTPPPALDAYWHASTADLLTALHTTAAGLTTAEAGERLRRYGRNALIARRSHTALDLLVKQILHYNFISDIPGMTIAGDSVDRELVE